MFELTERPKEPIGQKIGDTDSNSRNWLKVKTNVNSLTDDQTCGGHIHGGPTATVADMRCQIWVTQALEQLSTYSVRLAVSIL